MAERTIRFYKIVTREKERFPNEVPFDDLRSAVEELPDDKAYVQLSRMEILGSAWAPWRGTGAKRRVPLIALDRITREPHLRIERQRNYRPFVLGTDETLAEPTFYSIFPDNVLGIMRNSGDSPGPASIREYVNLLGIIKPDIEIVPLVDANAVRALQNVGTLTKLHFAVGPDVDPIEFSRSSLIYDTLRNMRRQLGGVSIEVFIKIAPKGQAQASDNALQQIRQIVTSDALGYADKAKIYYRDIENGKAASYDFIQEAVTATAIVDLDSGTSQPTEPSVSEAMATAYDELYDDIRSALNSAS